MSLLRNSVTHRALVVWSKPSLALLLVAFAGGCGARSEYPAASVGSPYPQQVAAAPAPREEMEDDGLPVQRPPLARSVNQPDDPSEPFSRNYGGPAPAAPKKAAAIPGDLPPAFRKRLVVATGAE
ncbi:MAG: adhesin [Hyphomicrobiaceae bacterium]|nr:adhesin [Hyphomicrobiaceae bacterium]